MAGKGAPPRFIDFFLRKFIRRTCAISTYGESEQVEHRLWAFTSPLVVGLVNFYWFPRTYIWERSFFEKEVEPLAQGVNLLPATWMAWAGHEVCLRWNVVYIIHFHSVEPLTHKYLASFLISQTFWKLKGLFRPVLRLCEKWKGISAQEKWQVNTVIIKKIGWKVTKWLIRYYI